MRRAISHSHSWALLTVREWSVLALLNGLWMFCEPLSFSLLLGLNFHEIVVHLDSLGSFGLRA